MTAVSPEFEPRASGVRVTEDSLEVQLVDGRTLIVPVAWFPRLLHATPAEQANFELLGDGQGIHWPDIDEDISVTGLLLGRGARSRGAGLEALAD